MRAFLASSLLAFSLTSALAAPAIPQEEYRSRRAALRKDLDGAVILFGKTEGPDEVYGFVQEENFEYLTGWTQPGAMLLVTPDDEILFLPHHRGRRELYMGKRGSAEDGDIRTVAGFDHVLGAEKFESQCDKALSEHESAYTLASDPEARKLASRYSLREFGSAAPLVAKLRAKKSPAEIAAIQHSTDVSIEGHRAAWKKIAPGLYEYQVAATLTYVYMENGCERHAYAPIVGSGPNSTVLHYSSNRRRMDQGEIIVMDTAAECADYASDITRTIPVSGKFTPRQREIYEIVLGAQKAAIAAIKPGVSMLGEHGLNQIARDYINTHGKDKHGQPLGKYFIHGLGHPVGLDVHDPGTPGPLEAGMVITVEPGIYIPEENLGVRIEDVVLVTENGSKVLSAALPKEPDDVEKALAK